MKTCEVLPNHRHFRSKAIFEYAKKLGVLSEDFTSLYFGNHELTFSMYGFVFRIRGSKAVKIDVLIKTPKSPKWKTIKKLSPQKLTYFVFDPVEKKHINIVEEFLRGMFSEIKLLANYLSLESGSTLLDKDGYTKWQNARKSPKFDENLFQFNYQTIVEKLIGEEYKEQVYKVEFIDGTWVKSPLIAIKATLYGESCDTYSFTIKKNNLGEFKVFYFEASTRFHYPKERVMNHLCKCAEQLANLLPEQVKSLFYVF